MLMTFDTEILSTGIPKHVLKNAQCTPFEQERGKEIMADSHSKRC